MSFTAPRLRGSTLRGGLVVVTIGLVAPAWAQGQIGGSVVLSSDDRYRGISQSDGQADLRLTVTYDHPSGAYAGLSAAGTRLQPQPGQFSLQAYAGFTGDFTGNFGPATQWRWDSGLRLNHYPGQPMQAEVEAYAGLQGQRWSGRLFVAPNYFGTPVATAYADLNAGWPLGNSWQLQAHAGALRRLDGRQGNRRDALLAVAWSPGALSWQLAWVGVQPGGPFAAPAAQRRQTGVLTVAYPF